jgi:hypothetical protein
MVPRLEKQIEAKIVQHVKALGGLAFKFTSPAHPGVPDRLLVFPGNVVIFMEVKRKGNKPTDLQVREMENLMGRGCNVTWVDSVEEAKEFIHEVLSTRAPETGN